MRAPALASDLLRALLMSAHVSLNSGPDFFLRIQPQLLGSNKPFVARDALDFPPGESRKVPHILRIEGDAKELLLSKIEGPPKRTTLDITECLYSGNSEHIISLLGEQQAFISAAHWWKLMELGGSSGARIWAGGKPLYAFMRAGLDRFVVRTVWMSDMADTSLSGFMVGAYRLRPEKQWLCGEEFIAYQPA